MRLVFVNYSHPAMQHISAVRLREFAHAMARRGHKVILISSALKGENALSPHDLARALDRHDWSSPFHLACASTPMALLRLARERRLPAVLRRAVSLWSLVLGDGPWHDWVAGSKPYWPVLAERFAPEVVWTNFGSLSDLALAQGLAHRAGAPWCADIKDNMEAFLPAPVRPIVRRRYSDAAGFTANARFHAEHAIFGRPCEVIYSGADDAMIALSRTPVPRDAFRIMLVGSIYSGEHFGGYLQGLDLFLSRLSPEQQARVELCYAGNEAVRVSEAVARTSPRIRLAALGFLSPAALCEAYARATVMSYVWAGHGFHHKTVEMLATGRPVVCFPDEHPESRGIAAAMHGRLLTPATSADLADAFDSLHRRWLDDDHGPPDAVDPRAFTWDAGADTLDRILERVVRANASASEIHPRQSPVHAT